MWLFQISHFVPVISQLNIYSPSVHVSVLQPSFKLKLNDSSLGISSGSCMTSLGLAYLTVMSFSFPLLLDSSCKDFPDNSKEPMMQCIRRQRAGAGDWVCCTCKRFLNRKGLFTVSRARYRTQNKKDLNHLDSSRSKRQHCKTCQHAPLPSVSVFSVIRWACSSRLVCQNHEENISKYNKSNTLMSPPLSPVMKTCVQCRVQTRLTLRGNALYYSLFSQQ